MAYITLSDIMHHIYTRDVATCILVDFHYDHSVSCILTQNLDGIINVRPVARICRRGVTWMSDLYVCVHKHAGLYRGCGGMLPQQIFRN